MRVQRHHAGRLLVAAGACTLVAGFTLPRTEAAADPPGGNGTVKVDEIAFDGGAGSGPGNDNDPHLDDCSGQVEWYGFDTGELAATVTFTVSPPTDATAPDAETQLVLQTVVHDGDGPGVPNDAAALDGVLPFDLTELLEPFTPQPAQGYHVKIQVETPGTQGNDVKHKVFWIEACDGGTTTTTSSTTTTAGETTTTEGLTSTTDAGVITTSTAPTGSSTTVLGTNIGQGTGTTLPTEVAGVQLARTGLAESLLVVGFGLVGAGLVVELLFKPIERRRAA
jgi:hypothetical protein